MMRMRTTINAALLTVAMLALGGCPAGNPANPFLTFTETFGTDLLGDQQTGDGGGGAGGDVATGEFRRQMTVTFNNFHPSAELNVSFAAWVNASSIRTADQQDSLIRSGYVQLTREVELGSVFTLPPGTFVFNGTGVAGTTRLIIPPGTTTTDGEPADDGEDSEGDAGEVSSTSRAVSFVTPDVVLVYQAPPVSCDSIAFTYEQNGEVIPPDRFGRDGFAGNNLSGGYKVLSQIEGYQCEPLRPGFFLKLGGGAKGSNEYFEGEDLTLDFSAGPDADGDFCFVTIE